MAMAQAAQGGVKRRLQPWLPKRPGQAPVRRNWASAREAPVVPVGASAATKVIRCGLLGAKTRDDRKRGTGIRVERTNGVPSAGNAPPTLTTKSPTTQYRSRDRTSQ